MSLLRRIERGGQADDPNGPEQSGLANMRRRTPVPAPSGALNAARAGENTYLDLKTRVQTKLLAELIPSTPVPEVRATIELAQPGGRNAGAGRSASVCLRRSSPRSGLRRWARWRKTTSAEIMAWPGVYVEIAATSSSKRYVRG